MKDQFTIKDLIEHDISEYQQFSSMLSKTVHDINNPLAVLIGQLSIVDILKEKDKLTPEKMDQILAKLKSSSETFKERLNYLRSFYKIPLNDENFQTVANVGASVLYFLDKLAYNHDINLVSHIDENLQVSIQSDRLFLMLKHLMINSIEALAGVSQNGGTVHLTASKIDDMVLIEVTDSGPGLVCDLLLAKELGYTTKHFSHKGTGLSIVGEIATLNQIEFSYEKTDKTIFKLLCPTK